MKYSEHINNGTTNRLFIKSLLYMFSWVFHQVIVAYVFMGFFQVIVAYVHGFLIKSLLHMFLQVFYQVNFCICFHVFFIKSLLHMFSFFKVIVAYVFTDF